MKILDTVFPEGGKGSVKTEIGDNRYTVSFIPSSRQELTNMSVTFRFEFQKNDAFFANGYQSWTHSPERSIRERFYRPLKFCPGFIDRKYGFSQYGDGHFCSFKDRKGVIHGYTYAYVRRNDEWFLFASLAEDTGFTRIILDAGKNTVTFEKDCVGKIAEAGEEYKVFDLYFPTGSESEVFDLWFGKLGVTSPTDVAAVGYTSWYNCYQDICEKQILEDLEGMKSLPVRPAIFQIDDGFEKYVGDWLTVDKKKFPKGLEPIVSKITDADLIPGIWLAPFVCEKKSEVYKKHSDWLLRNKDGKPIYCGSNWSGAYALDTLNKEVRDYVVRSIATYVNMGFRLFKLDFLYAACMIPHDGKTRGELMEDAASLLREACGDAAIIGCGIPLCAAFGRMEYCRIGPDVSLDYDNKPLMRLFHAERTSTKNAIENTLYRRQLSGRAFLNDPDVFILRTENTTLTETQKQFLATVNGLYGGVLFASDKFSMYTPEQNKAYGEVCALMNAKNVSFVRSKEEITFTYTLNGDKFSRTFPLKEKKKSKEENKPTDVQKV